MLPTTPRYEIQVLIIIENFTWGHLLNVVGTLSFYMCFYLITFMKTANRSGRDLGRVKGQVYAGKNRDSARMLMNRNSRLIDI